MIFPSTRWLKNTIFFTSKYFKTRTLLLIVNMIFHAKENLTISFFFSVELKQPAPHFLGYPNFVNTIERSSLYQLTALKKILKIHNFNFSFILKFINFSFLPNMNFTQCKVHVLIIISFFHKNLFLIIILKGLKVKLN